MNSEFVTLPVTRSGSSVKLKAKNIHKLRVENLQLEMQNQEMQQKLNQLRQSMSREKEERERSNGYHWKSGQAGYQFHNQDKENIGKISSGQIKFKVLKNPIPEPGKEKPVSRPTNMTVTEKPKIKGKPCGQCESKSALLKCLECGEDYCSACFAKIHQKGALKLHRSTPIQAFYSPSRKQSGSGGLLMHGEFCETESAKSFSDALMEWRNNQKKHSVLDTEMGNSTEQLSSLTFKDGADILCNCTGNSEAQTVMTIVKKPFEVEFKEDGLNYLEKLMLKKHRRTPVNHFASKPLDKCRYSSTSVSDHELNDFDGLTAEEVEEHEQYVALFKPEKDAPDMVTYEPALEIMEIDEDPEEDREKPRSFSVSERKRNETIQNTPLDTERTQSTLIHATVSDALPVRAANKKRNAPLRSTYSVGREIGLESAEGGRPMCTQNAKASLQEDSKSITYKSFNDRPSPDTASIANLPKALESIGLREKSPVSEYHGLAGFFILGVDPKEVRPEHRRPQTYERGIETSTICAGQSYWRPESSLSDCADDNIVHEIVEKAQAQYLCNFMEQSFSPRPSSQRSLQRPLTGGHYKRPSSARSTWQISESSRTPRPSSATIRPLSRAASEISEIEFIDSTDNDDPLSELTEEQKMLTVLGKELDALRYLPGNTDANYPVTSNGPVQSTRRGKLSTLDAQSPLMARLPPNSSHMISMESLQSCDGESDSGEDEESLQDKLNVLSLQ
ncbi:zinc finger B-box domain-containing protein 1 [Spea bombifrons]|uniref:zinc finger B-box domain-containing protein 1 n=1 Tax=Spea bombifrons TaxID=233779 RepID=UPI00234BF38F|nr:zinc finger B-box domain-containing protein 1 [Spea bombifrons]